MSRLSFCAPSTLRAHLPKLLTQGACLVLHGLKMPVPIPLNECIVLDHDRLLWATCHTPYGPVRPCVGQLEFAHWHLNENSDDACTLLDASDAVVATIIPHSELALTDGRAARLRAEQSRHLKRAAADPAYARRWSQRFREANLIHSTSPSSPTS